ncbi:MAG: sugar transferase [Bacillota bacterium]|nr:sugar transferase [Bacillota bacterium]
MKFRTVTTTAKISDMATEFANMFMGVRSTTTMIHSAYVKKYTELFCHGYNKMYPEKAFTPYQMQIIIEAAMLHDIGKIGISEDVLCKAEKFSGPEYETMKKHTIIGGQLAGKMADIYGLGAERQIFYDVCIYHHERYDGSGYPEGLVGDKIPIWAQIVSIVDAYDALTSKRVYKDAVSHDEAIKMIQSGKCGAFSPEIMSCFKEVASELEMVNSIFGERKKFIVNAYGKNKKTYWICKRTLDVISSFMGIVVLSPLMLFLCIAIWLKDPCGSPILKQTRVGRHKKLFTMYKFRTESVNKDKQINRIDKFGKFLRESSLDELPQLFNVIKGDMAIVGPRPALPEEVEQYTGYEAMRLSVTPGLTCEWQVQPKRDSMRFEKWMDLDMEYIGCRSVMKDIKLVIRTIWAVIRKDGQ